jgi:hypothetical protein
MNLSVLPDSMAESSIDSCGQGISQGVACKCEGVQVTLLEEVSNAQDDFRNRAQEDSSIAMEIGAPFADVSPAHLQSCSEVSVECGNSLEAVSLGTTLLARSCADHAPKATAKPVGSCRKLTDAAAITITRDEDGGQCDVQSSGKRLSETQLISAIVGDPSDAGNENNSCGVAFESVRTGTIEALGVVTNNAIEEQFATGNQTTTPVLIEEVLASPGQPAEHVNVLPAEESLQPSKSGIQLDKLPEEPSDQPSGELFV